MRKCLTIAMSGLGLALCSACGEAPAPPAPPPPAVTVAQVVVEDVAETLEFVGEIQATEMVELRARVSGTLEQRYFREGAMASEGDILYVIERDSYRAEVERQAALLAQAQARREKARLDYDRSKSLFQSDAISQAAYDKASTSLTSAEAEVLAQQAAKERADLDLSYTEIVATVDGRVGRTRVDVGNLVGPDSGALSTITRLDPMYVNFSISERLLLEVQREARDREARGEEAQVFSPQLRLSDGKLYDQLGELDFVEETVDVTTGSVGIRCVFPNPDQLLRPGQYVTVVMSREDPEPTALVPQAAVQSRQSGHFVLVVNDADEVEERKITTGERLGTRWVVEEGLEEGERVIVRGLQKVRPGTKVQAAFESPPGEV